VPRPYNPPPAKPTPSPELVRLTVTVTVAAELVALYEGDLLYSSGRFSYEQ
jgi:hypothetical protein